MNEDLMLAVLAMNAYNNPQNGSQIGTAMVIKVADQEDGFAAYAYDYYGQTVISYSGTNFSVGLNYGDSAFIIVKFVL